MERISKLALLVLQLLFCFRALSLSVADEPLERESSHNTTPASSNNTRSFAIDYENDVFLKDGKPFYFVSGSIHYFHAPRVYWRDRLRKMRAAGLNVLNTYVEWKSHEPSPGDYQFTDDNDVEYFIELAMEEDLLVILRPGPYICAERDFGGLPPWLLTKYPHMRIRTNDTDYENEVKRWFDVLFGRLTKHLYGNGGPIIMVQVENEYGGFEVCNMEHKLWIRDLLREHVQNAAVLFTIDPPDAMECGLVPGVYATIDFGIERKVNETFAVLRKFTPHGPLMNSEFYPGWYSRWSLPMERRDTKKFLTLMKEMLDMKAYFSIYMFSGGTNFGFANGANYFPEGDLYSPEITSYDFDAPLDEAGDPTPKYFEIRNLLSNYIKLPDLPVPEPQPKGKYGKVHLDAVCSIFNYSNIEDKVVWRSVEPKTFESLNIGHGYVLYETTIPDNVPDPAVLYVSDLHDRAVVFVDRNPVGILDRTRHIKSIPLLAPPGRTLSLLVENQGHINYGPRTGDMKGLISVPLLNNVPLANWTMVGLPFDDISWAYSMSSSVESKVNPPAVYVGELILPSGTKPQDTYIDLTGWGKGVIFINDFNLGRYWPSMGPQVTIFVPGHHLRPHPLNNYIVVFETEYAPSRQEIVFTDVPNLDKIPPKVHP